MASVSRFLRKLRLLIGRGKFRDELHEEMAFHRAAAEREFVAEVTRDSALRRFPEGRFRWNRSYR